MNEAIVEILFGMLGVGLGGLALYGVSRERVHPWLRSWWIPNKEEYEIGHKIMAGVVGTGFLLVGLLMLIGGISTLLH